MGAKLTKEETPKFEWMVCNSFKSELFLLLFEIEIIEQAVLSRGTLIVVWEETECLFYLTYLRLFQP